MSRGGWCCKDGHNVRENPSSSSEVTLLTIWESTLLGHVLAPRGCWIRTDSQASILGCGDSLTARELNRTSASRRKAGRRVTLKGLCIWSTGALFSAWMPSSKRSFSTRGVSSDLPLPNLPVRVEVKLPGKSWEKEGETFCSRHPWKMELG